MVSTVMTYLPKSIVMFDQMNPCAMYVLHNWQEQSFGDQDVLDF